MAYAALVSLSQTIEKLLHDQDQYPISPHVKQRLISIHEQIILFRDFLEDDSEKGSGLEGRIRGVANEAEDIIEYFMWKRGQRRNCTIKVSHRRGVRIDPKTMKKRNIIRYALWDYIDQQESSAGTGSRTDQVSQPSDVCFDFQSLGKVAEEIESIAAEVINSARTEDVQQLRDSSSASASSSSSSSSRLVVGSIGCKLDMAMVGFEDDLMAVKVRLCGESSKLQVIPIWGMGGIGKTTLAKNAYDDQLTFEHFQVRGWVTVSQEYSAQHILSSLLVSVAGGRCEESDESKIAENVYKSLKGKRYLIVMDDMWSTTAWDEVRMIFPDDNNGSRIILTTRLSEVAAYPDSCSPLHQMRFMDADQSWNLLRKKVFPHGNCPTELEDIGKMIAKSCKGLPLAIVVIAGLLSTVSQTPASWKNIARNVNEVVSTNDEQFARILLSLSYNNLPHHLRPCFLYMGVFPEDYEVRASKLTKLWVAEGFLKLPNGSKTCEEVAEEYLEDLVKRSLVLVTKRKSNGKIKSCNVHDLVRDLCIRKAQQETFLVRINDRRALQESIRNQRRVSIAHYADLNCLKDISGARARTIICTMRTVSSRKGCIWNCLRSIKLLRVFDLADEIFRFQSYARLPRVLELFQLRYLTLPYQMKIPAVISSLESLQTLVIYEGKRYIISRTKVPPVCLPSEVWRMPQLRHLVSSCHFDGFPDSKAAALGNLHTLSNVKKFRCTKDILQRIPNLKKLGISYSEDEYAGGDYQLENLQYLHRLEKLTVRIDFVLGIKHEMKFVFPSSLKKLTLSGGQIPWEDMRIIGLLPNLEVLKLRMYACVGDEWETSEGEFPRLKFLLIERSELRYWIAESSHFPSLKCLVLHSCGHLDAIPDSIGEIPTLELIEVDDKNKSLVDSAKWIQEEQQSWGNDAFQVRKLSYNPWNTVRFLIFSHQKINSRSRSDNQ